MRNKTHSRHDRLAIRLSVIISRLMAGEELNLKTLADEFGVSERTLQRDFHQRLGHLDITCHNGGYQLFREPQSDGSPATLSFIRNTGISRIFPLKDNTLLQLLTNNSGTSPCLIWHAPLKPHVAFPEFFTHLAKAISAQLQIALLVGGQRHDPLEPYRLIHYGEEWYLVVNHRGGIQVFALSVIDAVTLSDKHFARSEDISYQTACEGFIAALPHFPLISDVINTFRK